VNDADGCVASDAGALLDVDPTDSPEVPWPRPPGQKVDVYFVNRGAAARYWADVARGAEIWSKSPCLQAQTSDACPANANCVTVTQKKKSPDGDDTDGEFAGDDRGGRRVGGTLTVYTGLMDAESDNGALATIVHEMGHAFGLVHRRDPHDLMNADTEDDTNPIPDAIDFENLLVIYGQKP
jgi:hypothetical protein